MSNIDEIRLGFETAYIDGSVVSSNSSYALSFDEFYENYSERYKIIKHQREVAKQEEITSIEKYKLQPNSMQVGFITNLKKILDAGEDRALLISATGTGKTYASAFAMRELGFKRVLFLVHRGQLARQTKKSYGKVFAKSVSMGLVGILCRQTFLAHHRFGRRCQCQCTAIQHC